MIFAAGCPKMTVGRQRGALERCTNSDATAGGIRGTPVEIVESRAPLLFKRKELRPDSGGPGTFRGGLGQTVHVQMRNERPTTMITRFDRCTLPARGLEGGHAGALGAVRRPDGTPLPSKGEIILASGEEVILDLPGGGGFGSPLERDPLVVLEDVRNGYVSPQQAATCYGVVIDPDTLEVDAAATAARRQAQAAD